MDIIIKNIDMIPVNGKDDYLKKQNIYIKDEKIVEISSGNLNYEAERIIDGKDKLAMPGLINAHTHLGMAILRNYADDMELFQWLEEKIWPIEAKFNRDIIHKSSLLSLVEMVKSGTTTAADMYFQMDTVADSIIEIGMRASICRGTTDNNDYDLNKAAIGNMRKLYENYNGAANGKIQVMVGAHAPYSCGTEYLKMCRDLAKELDTSIHIHVSETQKELDDSIEEKNMTPVEYLESIGLLELDVLAAHCVALTENDKKIIKEKGVFPVNNPVSNLKLASGFSDVDGMLKMGIPVALGTDSASSNNNLDMLEEMKLAGILNKAVNSDPISVSAKEVIEMATINGAKALNMDDKVGSLEIGKEADIILLDMKQPHLWPENDPMAAVVYSARGSDVDTVIIQGEIIVDNKKLLTIDEEKLMDEITILQSELEM